MEDIDFNLAITKFVTKSQWKRNPKENEFYPSELTGCVRQAVRHRLNLGSYSPEDLKAFHVGTMIHHFLQKDLGLGYYGVPCEFEKTFTLEAGKYIITGHIDMFANNTVYDFKSSADIKYPKKYNMMKSYIYQVSCYVHGVKADKGKIVYVDKRNLEVFIKEVDIIPLDDLIKFLDEVTIAVQKYKENGELPSLCDCFGCLKESGKK